MTDDATPKERPLSPFMLGTYYRLQMTSVSSILTRITGNALVVGFMLGIWWLLAAATGPDYFATVDGLITSWIGNLILLGSSWALCYHLLNGIRHLVWDMGYGFEVEIADKSGLAVAAGSGVLTLILWILA